MPRIVVLIGGVGGAKLALGLANLRPTPRLTFIVNSGDDFWHLGLRVCPDMDTLVYTLAGMVNPEMGWGVADDTTHALDHLRARYGVDPWFKLGDRDLGMHLLRTQALRAGMRLTEFTVDVAARLGIDASILPMCDAEMPTIIETQDGDELSFQEYFVKYRWQPKVRRIRYCASKDAGMTIEARAALESADMVWIAPSNPWLSIAPILAAPGMRETLRQLRAPRIAFTPVIGGEAVKGPTAKIMRELGLQPGAAAVAGFYAGLIDGFVNDLRNPPLDVDGLRCIQLDTLMTDLDSKVALASAALDWLRGWRT